MYSTRAVSPHLISKVGKDANKAEFTHSFGVVTSSLESPNHNMTFASSKRAKFLFSPRVSAPLQTLQLPSYLFIISLRSQQLLLIFLLKLNTPVACVIISVSEQFCDPSLARTLLQLPIARVRLARVHLRIFGCSISVDWIAAAVIIRTFMLIKKTFVQHKRGQEDPLSLMHSYERE